MLILNNGMDFSNSTTHMKSVHIDVLILILSVPISIHPSSATYPRPGCGGSRLSKAVQVSLLPATQEIPKPDEIHKLPTMLWVSYQLDMSEKTPACLNHQGAAAVLRAPSGVSIPSLEVLDQPPNGGNLFWPLVSMISFSFVPPAAIQKRPRWYDHKVYHWSLA